MLSFAFFVMAVSLFRELLGKGSIFGVKVLGSLQISTVLMPFFGFILVGMLSAFCRQVNPVDPGLVPDQGPGRGHGRQDRGGEGIRWLVL